MQLVLPVHTHVLPLEYLSNVNAYDPVDNPQIRLQGNADLNG